MYGPEAASGGVATHTKNLVEELEKLGVVIIHHSCSGSIYHKFYQRTFGLVFKSIKRREEYDIIHIQASGGIFSFISAITGAIATKILSKKLVVTFHYSKTQKFVENHKFLFKFVLECSDKMILVSDNQKEAITAVFGDISVKTVVIPNGFKKWLFHLMDKDKCRQQLMLPLNKKIIFNISNLIESKGHQYLLLAMSEIFSESNNYLCYIAGKGNFEAILYTQVAELQLQKCVTFLGWIPDNDVPLWMNAADLFVLPSLNEGNQTVMFEDLECGMAFVSTRVGGVPEIITSDIFRFLIEPGNKKELSEKILLAIDKKWDREAISKYSEQFTWENIAQQTIVVYQEAFK